MRFPLGLSFKYLDNYFENTWIRVAYIRCLISHNIVLYITILCKKLFMYVLHKYVKTKANAVLIC